MTFLLMFVYLGLPKIAYDQPIPENVWQIQQEPTKGIFDAVILEDITELTATNVNRYRKVRILTENGKAAAEFIDSTGTAKRLVGRVVDRSGKQTRLNQKEDLVEVLDFKTRRTGKDKTRLLLPPGLTSDCVVEMSWTIPAQEGMPMNIWQQRYYVPDSFYCLKKQFIVSKTVRKVRSGYFPAQHVWSVVKDGNYDHQRKGGDDIITYSNVAPFEVQPFGSPYHDPTARFLVSYRTFPNYGNNVKVFWQNVANDYLKNYQFAAKFKRDKTYKSWLSGVKTQLAGNSIERLTALIPLFKQRMASTELLSPSQRASVNRLTTGKEDPDKVLGNAWKRGYARPDVLAEMFMHVAHDCGIPVKLAFANPYNDDTLVPNAMQPFVINYNYPMFALAAGNGHRYFNIHRYEYDAGYIPSSYEGMPAFIVDPKNGWGYGFQNIPAFGAGAHKMITQYTTQMGADGSLKMTSNRQVTGSILASWRRTYFPLPADEQNAQLMNEWQNRLPSWTISDARVSGGSDLTSVIKEDVVMETTMGVDESMIFFSPFPNSYVPLSQPAIWSKVRSQPIYLPHARTDISLNQITLPDGWTVEGNPSWKRENSIGSITFGVRQEGNQLMVRRDVVLNRSRHTAQAVRELKTFLAWMDEAYQQSIGLTIAKEGQE